MGKKSPAAQVGNTENGLENQFDTGRPVRPSLTSRRVGSAPGPQLAAVTHLGALKAGPRPAIDEGAGAGCGDGRGGWRGHAACHLCAGPRRHLDSRQEHRAGQHSRFPCQVTMHGQASK